jgi:hypothetical protein
MSAEETYYLLKQTGSDPRYTYDVLEDFVGAFVGAERDRILAIIEETAQRYSRGSVTRVALDNLALEIRERG